MHPDGTKLYIPQPNELVIYDPETGDRIGAILHPSIVQPTGVCIARVR